MRMSGSGTCIGITEERFNRIRRELNDFGYHQALNLQSVPLVERLIKDLIDATDSLQYYKDIADKLIKEKQYFDLGVEAYRLDNKKLVQQCNELHSKLIKQEEEAKCSLLEQARKLHEVEIRYEDLQVLSRKQTEQIKELKDLVGRSKKTQEQKSNKIISRQPVKAGVKKKTVPVHQPLSAKDELNGTLQLSEELVKELDSSRKECLELADTITLLRMQLRNRDSELDRLTSMLEGGRCVEAVCRDYECQSFGEQLSTLKKELDRVNNVNKELKDQLKSSICKQHEAMTHAVRLADRNEKLEMKLQKMNELSSAVEAECSSAVHENSRKVIEAQDKIEKTLLKITELEKTCVELKHDKLNVEENLHSVVNEKVLLQKNLDKVREEKRRLTDRLNEFIIAEEDMKLEIERLKCFDTRQKERIRDLESRLSRTLEDVCFRECRAVQTSPQQTGDTSGRNSIDMPDSVDASQVRELKKLLKEREEEVTELRRKFSETLNKTKRPENHSDVHEETVMSSRCHSLQSTIRRLERERDIARGDIIRLEEERDALRERLKRVAENQVSEQSRLEKTVIENEAAMHRLETERRELMMAETRNASNIKSLNEQLDNAKRQLQNIQEELLQQRSLNNQIKSLQQQTDRALVESQSQVNQLEVNLSTAHSRIKDLERERSQMDKELSALRSEVTLLKGNLTEYDRQKDSLLVSVDNKTEQVALLEHELKMKEKRIISFEQAVAELQKKLDITLDESLAREQTVRNTERTLTSVQQELETTRRNQEALERENRRLQDDLASAIQDSRIAHRDLEVSRQEVETLKRQLQDYVAKVSLFEEKLAQQEAERSEMLEHFRSLSVEATVLETNSHTLQNEAQEVRTQLSAAGERISDLEEQMTTRDALVRSYETQIAEMSAHIASLEAQLRQKSDYSIRLESDVRALRELCAKLDAQKDGIQQQLAEADVIKIHLESDLSHLQDEKKLLEDSLRKERENVISLEQNLAKLRTEAMNEKLASNEIKEELSHLRTRLTKVQENLDAESARVHQFANQNNELNQKITDLRRQLSNERFERARAQESKSTTL